MTENSRQNPTQNIPKQSNQVEDISRRGFLNTAGCAAVGGLVIAAGGSLLAEKDATATTAPAAPALPWKYKKLDPKEAGKRGYKNYLLRGG